MSRTRKLKVVLVACGFAAVSLAAVVAQSALAQFKITEAEARDLLLYELNAGVGSHANSSRGVAAARKAIATIPAASRGAAATAIYGWTRTYVSSPAFRTAYAAFRKENTPFLRTHQGTVDEQIAREVAKEKAELDAVVKQLIAAGQKQQAEAIAKQAPPYGDKTYLQSRRFDVEDRRARDQQNNERAMKTFNERLPVDPMDSIALHLKAFLANTTDVDFAAAQKTEVRDIDGSKYKVFVNAVYNKKPWQWQFAHEVGADATKAARAAAAAWLKDAGK